MKMKLNLLCAAGVLTVIVAGCNSPQLVGVPYTEAENQWAEYISYSYPAWKTPQTVPPSSSNEAVTVPLEPILQTPISATPVIPPVVVPAGDKKVEAHTYTIEKGDTLSTIAKKVYGKSSKWPVILEANKDKITDAGKLKVGMTIKIPAQ
ncbi:MAG: LysM peptidoglycan-binding domain-containing protein [Victivallales bacterium]